MTVAIRRVEPASLGKLRLSRSCMCEGRKKRQIPRVEQLIHCTGVLLARQDGRSRNVRYKHLRKESYPVSLHADLPTSTVATTRQNDRDEVRYKKDVVNA